MKLKLFIILSGAVFIVGGFFLTHKIVEAAQQLRMRQQYTCEIVTIAPDPARPNWVIMTGFNKCIRLFPKGKGAVVNPATVPGSTPVPRPTDEEPGIQPTHPWIGPPSQTPMPPPCPGC